MRRWIVTIAFIFCGSGGAFAAKDFKGVEAATEAGESARAIDLLLDMDDSVLGSEEKELKYFSLGKLQFEAGKLEDAQKNILLSVLHGSKFDPYKELYLGRIALNEKNNLKARQHFLKSLRLKPQRNIKSELKYHLGQLDLKERKWQGAYRNFKYLDRKWKNTPRHGEVLWNLVKVELERKRKWKACRWARKLYSRYPAHPLVSHWGIDLQKAEFEGKVLGCIPSPSDQKRRAQRFLWAGESKRSFEEINQLYERTTASTRYNVDSMLANYYVREGLVEDSLKLIIKHYDAKKNNFSYLMLLGKSAARAGEYQAAVGSYYKAYNLNPRSREGREALFKAAFLSYQFQDYDGAVRKYRELINKFPRSGLSRDAQWHLAWVRYLKADYKGAVNGFKNVARKKARKRWRWRKFSSEKIKYWLGMSYLRSGESDRAKEIFVELAQDRLLGYYALAAQYRLLTMGDINIQQILSQQGVIEKREVASVFEDGVQPPAAILPTPDEAILEQGQNGEEEESEDQLAVAKDEDKEEDKDGAEELDKEEQVVISGVRDSRLKKRFESALGLMKVGENDLSKWELYEIERRTSRPNYLKLLMKSYQQVGAYNRSSYIASISFSKQRKRYGIQGVRYLWEYSYPRAYEEYVTKYSQAFMVPEELIWGIMRAETMYRPDIVSPVGAKGLMQIMPYTGRRLANILGESDFEEQKLSDPQTNIRLGTRYLKRLATKFEGQIPLVAAGYNAGPHRVETWLRQFGDRDMDEFIEHIPFIETRNYVKKVVRYFGIYQALYHQKNMAMSWLSKPVPVRREGPAPTRENWDSL